MTSKAKKILRYKDIALLLFGITLLLLIVYYIGVGTIVQNIKSVEPMYFYAFLLLKASYFLLWNYNWKLLVDKVKPIKYTALLPVFAAGIFGNNMTPGPSMGGEPIKAYFLSKLYGGSVSSWLATTVMSGVLLLIGKIAFLLLSIFYIISFFELPLLIIFLVGGLAFVTVLVIMGWYVYERKESEQLHRLLERGLRKIYNIKFLRKKFPQYIDFKQKIIEECVLFKDVIVRTFTMKGKLLLAFLVAFVVILVNFSSVYMLFLGLGVKISFIKIIVAITIGNTIAYFVLLPGGTGVVEGTMIMIFAAMGVPLGIAATATLINRAILYVAAYGFGSASLVYLNLKLKKNK